MSGPPRLTTVHVMGVYETGYQELDKTLAYASLALADAVLSPRAASAFIGVKVADPFGDLSAVSRAVSAAAGHGARAVGWREIEYSRLASFRTTKALLLFIMGLIVLVASVNVSSSVLMIVFERRHDLGILKSVGAGPRSLALSFLLTGFVTGLVGTAAGVGLGLLVAVNVNEVISGLEWLVNVTLEVASLVRASFVPVSATPGVVHALQQRLLLEGHSHPSRRPGGHRRRGRVPASGGICLLRPRVSRLPGQASGDSEEGLMGRWRPLAIRRGPRPAVA